CDCWLRFSLSVVPAKAGTHNHRTLEYRSPRARGRPNGQSDRELARDWQKLSGDVQSETTEECCGRRRAMKVFMFHLMPYAYLDMGYTDKYRAAWVVLPNTYFDPKKGHELYNRYLDELELAAELGFDGVSVNEHHQNAYGLMPSPVVMAAALSR